MIKIFLIALAVAAAVARSASAEPPRLPPGFVGRTIATPGAALYVQVGGSGSPVVLLHGYVESGDMWGPLATELMPRHTVIVPDLRGLARSSRPTGGYDKKTQARDIRAVVEALGFDRVALVGHDLGGMVAYAYAAQYPAGVTRLVIMEAVPPGIAPWADIVSIPAVWHFSFRGSDAERLVAGRERIYFDRFWNEFSADPARIDEDTRNHFATQYAAPGAMRAGFAQFAAFDQDARDNAEFARNSLTMPVLAIGGDRSDRAFSGTTARAMRKLAANVEESLIPAAGHWLLEENPQSTVARVSAFLSRP
jgi:pimeloyl-ACP methyl ester carboxylesterase